MAGQTAIAGIVAFGAGYGVVVIVEVLRTGAPAQHHRPLRGVTGDTLDGRSHTG